MLARLYAELDCIYIYPFCDDNSQALRTFTKQLAEVPGYVLVLDWERFNRSGAGRDMLYIARDKSVNKLACPHI